MARTLIVTSDDFGASPAVNEAVVIAFMGVFAFNYVFTQTLLATHPEISTIK